MAHTLAMGAEDYNVIVGQQVQTARNSAGLSQDDVAQRMNNLGYASWTAQTVSGAEAGQYQLAAAEVLGISLALEIVVASSLAPSSGVEWTVQLTGGPVVVVGESVSITWSSNSPVIPPTATVSAPVTTSEPGSTIQAPTEKTSHV
jgi:hypothetical protein